MEIKLQDIVQCANMMERAVKADDIRTQHGECTIVLFKVGNNYESYNESAEFVHDICQTPLFFMGSLTSTDFKEERLDTILPKLIREGHKICIFEKGQY